MANIGAQAATAVDEKIREFRTLQTELNTHRSDLGTLMAQRNENEMVKQVSCWLLWLFVVWLCVAMVLYIDMCLHALLCAYNICLQLTVLICTDYT